MWLTISVVALILFAVLSRVASSSSSEDRDAHPLLILPTAGLARLLGEQLPDLSEPGTAAVLFREYWGRFEGQIWIDGLDRAFERLLDTDQLIVDNVLSALGGEGARTLHLAAFDAERPPVGGFSIRLEPVRRERPDPQERPRSR